MPSESLPEHNYTKREARLLDQADRAFVRICDWLDQIDHEDFDGEFRDMLSQVKWRVQRLAEEAEATGV